METTNALGVIVDDMFFAAKIRAAAELSGKTMTSVKSIEQLDAFLDGGSERLLIVDLNSSRVDPLTAIRHVRSREDRAGVRIVSFVSHVETGLIREAQQAGCDFVLPRSAFTRFLPAIAAGDFGQLDSARVP